MFRKKYIKFKNRCNVKNILYKILLSKITGGGWMVMQRRDDFGVGDEHRENFNRNWHDYKYGFGDPGMYAIGRIVF